MKRILLIDDMRDTLDLYQTILEDEGYEVFKAINGDQGIQIANDESLDLVITDLFMEPKPGLETIIELKKSHPSLKIIAVSASVGNMNFLDLAKSMGADYILQKPVHLDILKSTVKKALR